MKRKLSAAKEAEHKLPSLSKVLGYLAIKDFGWLEDRVRVLARLGYGNAEIADICGVSPADVTKARKRLREYL